MGKDESNLYKLLIGNLFRNPREIATSYVETLDLKDDSIIKSKIRNFESYLSRIFNTNSISDKEMEYIAIAMHYKDDSKTKEEYQQLIRDARDADGRAQFDKRKYSEHQEFITELFVKYENLTEAFICTAKPFEVYKNEIGNNFVDKTIRMICEKSKKKITFCVNDAIIIRKFYENILSSFEKSDYYSSLKTSEELKVTKEDFEINFNQIIDVYLVSGIYTVFPSCIIDYYGDKFGFNVYSHSGSTLDFIKISNAGLERWRTEIYNRIESSDLIPYTKGIMKIDDITKKMKVIYTDIFPKTPNEQIN